MSQQSVKENNTYNVKLKKCFVRLKREDMEKKKLNLLLKKESREESQNVENSGDGSLSLTSEIPIPITRPMRKCKSSTTERRDSGDGSSEIPIPISRPTRKCTSSTRERRDSSSSSRSSSSSASGSSSNAVKKSGVKGRFRKRASSDYSCSSSPSDDESGSDYAVDKKFRNPTMKRNYLFNLKLKKKDRQKREERKLMSKIGFKHDDLCKICQDGGILLCCETCPLVYHQQCLRPQPEEQISMDDEAPWICPRCLAPPLPGTVSTILSWKFVDTKEYKEEYLLAGPDQRQYMAPPLKEFYCYFEGQSHWECSWITDIQFLAHQPMKTYLPWKRYMEEVDLEGKYLSTSLGYQNSNFNSNADNKNPDDDDEEEEEYVDELEEDNQENVGRLKQFGDVTGMREKYFDNGVKPGWLMMQRIVTHETDEVGDWYLVKWWSLPYENSTWESESTCAHHPIMLAQLHRQIQLYKDYKNIFESLRLSKRLQNGNVNGVNGEEEEEEEKEEEKFFEYKILPAPPKFLSRSESHKKPLEEFKKGETVDFLHPDLTGLSLHDYQVDGINWLRFTWQQKINTILADEMGLGKTIQAIMLIYSLYKQGYSSGPFLITAPLSTIINWETELRKWAPDFYVVTYVGPKESRKILRSYELTCDQQAAKKLKSHSILKIPSEGQDKLKFHVILTSYEYIYMEKACLSSIPYAVTVIDEAHRLKKSSGLFFKSLSTYNCGYKLAMTGTPLQNNLEELFNLLNFISPEKFCDLDSFLLEFSEISKEEQVKRIGELLGPHMLRRLKTDVLKDLPTKSELVLRVELTDMQKQFYKNILERNRSALNIKGGRITNLQHIFMDMLKCCNHPYLFSAAALTAPMDKRNTYEIESLTAASGKLILLRKMLKKLKEQGHRVLIFCQMTTMLDLLEDFLEGLGYGYERIDGSIAGEDRQEAINRFNSSTSKSFVFLLSTKAGGLGINLATADTVVLFDQDWNPHNDIQALARAHRIGQKNKVLVFRLVTIQSVEERVTLTAKKKMFLNHVVVESNRGTFGGRGRQSTGAKSLTKQELEAMIRFGAENLFKEDENSSSRKIIYTDEVVEKLLNREENSFQNSQDSQGSQDKVEISSQNKEQQHWFNEYLNSFKVAQYHVNTDADADADADADDEADLERENVDPDFWKKLLNSNGEVEKEKKEAKEAKKLKLLVDGKRPSKVRDAEEGMMKDMDGFEELVGDGDYQQPSSSASEADSESDSNNNKSSKPKEPSTEEDKKLVQNLSTEKGEEHPKRKRLIKTTTNNIKSSLALKSPKTTDVQPKQKKDKKLPRPKKQSTKDKTPIQSNWLQNLSTEKSKERPKHKKTFKNPAKSTKSPKTVDFQSSSDDDLPLAVIDILKQKREHSASDADNDNVPLAKRIKKKPKIRRPKVKNSKNPNSSKKNEEESDDDDNIPLQYLMERKRTDSSPNSRENKGREYLEISQPIAKFPAGPRNERKEESSSSAEDEDVPLASLLKRKKSIGKGTKAPTKISKFAADSDNDDDILVLN